METRFRTNPSGKPRGSPIRKAATPDQRRAKEDREGNHGRTRSGRIEEAGCLQSGLGACEAYIHRADRFSRRESLSGNSRWSTLQPGRRCKTSTGRFQHRTGLQSQGMRRFDPGIEEVFAAGRLVYPSAGGLPSSAQASPGVAYQAIRYFWSSYCQGWKSGMKYCPSIRSCAPIT